MKTTFTCSRTSLKSAVPLTLNPLMARQHSQTKIEKYNRTRFSVGCVEAGEADNSKQAAFSRKSLDFVFLIQRNFPLITDKSAHMLMSVTEEDNQ